MEALYLRERLRGKMITEKEQELLKRAFIADEIVYSETLFFDERGSG